MLMVTYQNRTMQELSQDVMQCLKFEQDLGNAFTRLVIRGKRGRKVTVLLTRETTESLDFLLENRSEKNGISDSND